MLGFPASTEFGKRIPKQKFYENLEVSPALRRVFVDQIRLVYWRNKLAASTLNIAAGEAVTEIEVFEVRLNDPQLDEAVLKQIDKEIPYHIEDYLAQNRIVFPGDYEFLKISKPVLRYWKEDDMKKAGDKFGKVAVSTKLPDNIGMSQDGTKEITNLLGTKAFSFPKPTVLIKYLISTSTEEGDFILDFFSGSATTAHAVMQLNAEDGGHRKFIMVQLPEKCDEASEAYKAGYKNICEIGKERIRRAGDKIKQALLNDGIAIRKMTEYKATQGNLEGFSYGEWMEAPEVIQAKEKMASSLDVGFRVLKLDDTNMKDVYYAPDDYDQGMLAGLESNIKDDRTDLDLLFGCLIDWGLPLSLPYKSEKIDGCTVHTYNDGDLIACFDANIPESVVKEIAQRRPLRAVFRDSGFASSPEKINVFEIFKLYMPEDANDISKRVRVI